MSFTRSAVTLLCRLGPRLGEVVAERTHCEHLVSCGPEARAPHGEQFTIRTKGATVTIATSKVRQAVGAVVEFTVTMNRHMQHHGQNKVWLLEFGQTYITGFQFYFSSLRSKRSQTVNSQYNRDVQIFNFFI